MADDIKIEVDLTELTKDLKKLEEAEKHAVKQAARAIGGEAVGFAKENCPVDTGLLRNSITFALSGEKPDISVYKADKKSPDTTKKNGKTKKGKVQVGSYSGTEPAEHNGLAVYIGSNVKYAEVQENGDFTHKTGSKHFLKKAATEHTDRYKQLLEKALQAAKVD